MKANLRIITRSFALLAMLLVVFASASALASEANTEDTTTASVSFLDGILEFPQNIGGSGMNLYFGINPLPVDTVAYQAVNTVDEKPASHILPVEDSRFNSGNWTVTVSMTPFASVGEETPSSFDAVIRLNDGVAANANANAGTAGLAVEASISVASGADPVPVMTASNTLPRGFFTATWTNQDITLNISGAEVGKIAHDEYNATLTWTLNIGPV